MKGYAVYYYQYEGLNNRSLGRTVRIYPGPLDNTGQHDVNFQSTQRRNIKQTGNTNLNNISQPVFYTEIRSTSDSEWIQGYWDTRVL